MTDAEAYLVEEPVPLGPRGDYRPRHSGYMGFGRVFDCVWAGRRHVMIGPIQIDRWGQTNLSGIGDLRKPKVQMLGMRGLPGNSTCHANSMFVTSHNKRVFVEGEVDIVGGVGYNAKRWPRRREPRPRRPAADRHGSLRARLRRRRPRDPRAVAAPRRHVRAGPGRDRLSARSGAEPPTTPGPTVEQLEIIRRLDPHGLRATVRNPPERRPPPDAPDERPCAIRCNTAVCEQLGSRYPIIQTAMGWVARPELVAASCNAGALRLPRGRRDERRREVGPAIDRVRSMTSRPFGVNFHMFQPGADRIVEILIEREGYGRELRSRTRPRR